MNKIHKEKLHKVLSPQFLAFVIPIVILAVLYMLRDIYPFGERAYMRMDFYHQYAPFAKEFIDRIRNGESLLYAWESGLGTNYWAHYAYYLATPLHWLLLLLPEKFVIEGMNITMVLRAGIAGFSMVRFLKEEHKENIMMAVFGIFYALSGYYLAYSCNIMWMDGYALFPLVALGVKRIAKGESAKLYTITMLVCTVSNFYLAVIAGMCCVVYLIVELIAGSRKTLKELGIIAGRFVGSTLLYVACCAVLLLPAAQALRNTPAGSSEFPEKTEFYFAFYELLERMCIMSESVLKGSDLPNIYASVFVLFCLVLFFCNAKIAKRKKAVYGLAVLFLLASFELNVLDYLWHGLHFPNSFPARQSFFYVFLVISMAYEAYDKRKSLHVAAVPSACIVYLVIFGLYCWFVGKDREFEGMEVFLFSIIIMAVYAVILTTEKYVPRIIFTILLMAICIGEIALNTLTMGISSSVIRESYMEDDVVTEALLAQIMPEENAFYRIEELDRKTVNDSSWDDYYGASYFSSTMPGGLKEFYDAFGMRTSSVSLSYQGATPMATSLLGIRYVFANDKMLPAGGFTETELSAGDDFVYLYENKWVLPLGYVMDAETEGNFVYDYNNPFKTQNSFASAVLGQDSELFLEMEKTEEDESVTSLSIAAGENVFIYVTTYMDAIEIETVNLETGEVSTEEYDDLKFKRILSPGVTEYDRKIFISSADDSVDTVRFYAYRMQEDIWKAVCKTLNSQPMEILTFSDTKIEARVEVTEGGVLFTSIPYDAGWTVKVNGQEVDTYAWKDAFLAINLDEGNWEITFSYLPEGFVPGLVISLMGCVCGTVLLVRKKKKKEKLEKA